MPGDNFVNLMIIERAGDVKLGQDLEMRTLPVAALHEWQYRKLIHRINDDLEGEE
jgi:hypothetical protein